MCVLGRAINSYPIHFDAKTAAFISSVDATTYLAPREARITVERIASRWEFITKHEILYYIAPAQIECHALASTGYVLHSYTQES